MKTLNQVGRCCHFEWLEGCGWNLDFGPSGSLGLCRVGGMSAEVRWVESLLVGQMTRVPASMGGGQWEREI